MSEDTIRQLIRARNPVVLKRADLQVKLDKDPTWRQGAQFTAAEVAGLLYDPRIPEDRRVLYAIEFLGGLRTGAAAARRWRDRDAEATPLGSLLVATDEPAAPRPERGGAGFC